MLSKKVCHLTSVHSIDDIRIFFKECSSLALNGFDVTLISCSNKNSEFYKNNVKCLSIRVPVKNRLQRFLKRSHVIFQEALKINAQIYHLHDPELLPVGKKLKKRGKIVIYDSHEDLPRQILYKNWIPKYLRIPLSIIIEKIENYYVKQLDGVITVSEHIKKRFDIISSKVVICHNYATLTEYSDVVEWNNNLRQNICYVGLISKIRGIINIVDASKSAEVKIEIAGTTNSKEILDKFKSSNVRYHGYLSRSDVKNLTSRCFAGIVTFLPSPNHTNSNPNKLYEYMAAGIPVIASNFPEWEKIVLENKLGLVVDPCNIEEICNAITFLKRNLEKAREMGANGRFAFENKYNWSIEEKKLLELYRSL